MQKKIGDNMIKNVVFDVGKVLVYYEPDWLMDNLGYDEETKKRMKAAMFHSATWDEGDRGLMNKEELLDAFIANDPELEDKMRVCYERVDEAIELMPHVMEWMEDLKGRGYNLYVISNYGENTYEKTEHKMKFFPYMNGMIFSYQYKMIKPDRIIYEQLLKEYKLEGSECVFIDDRQVNIDAAVNAGFGAGVLFQNYEQAKADLDALLEK